MAQEEDVLNLYDDDAQKLNEHHYKSQQTAKDSFNHAFEAGRILAEVKDRLPHGKFTAWVKARFEGSSRTARLYMQVHRAVSTGAVSKPDGSSWAYSLNRLLKAARERDAEPEPKETAPEPAASREPPASDDEYEEEVEGEEYLFPDEEDGADAETAPRESEPAAPREPSEPEKKPAARKRDLLQAAFNAIHRALEEVEGEERAERIRAIISRVKVYETTEVEPRQNRKMVTSKLRGRTVGTAADVVARLHPDGDAALGELAS